LRPTAHEYATDREQSFPQCNSNPFTFGERRMNEFDLMIKWRLSPSEASILFRLYRAAGVVDFMDLHDTVARGTKRCAALSKVHLSRLRRKAVQHGIQIETVRGEGYTLTPASVERLNEELAPQREQSN
jgi:DNA-binding response OmpR family regulator